jgi:glycosyltransferase involved in cell wall biosynthesis
MNTPYPPLPSPPLRTTVEGFNLPVLESLATGCHVVVPRTGSTKEFVEDIYSNGGQHYISYIDSTVSFDLYTGLSQNEMTVESVVAAVTDAYSKTYKVQKPVGSYSRMKAHIEAKYSWSTVVGMLYQYLRDVVEMAKGQ